jgi:carotenoid cleavage dioxygenase-like enzyme
MPCHAVIGIDMQEHMFDGLAMATRLSIRRGHVTGTQRFVQTQQFQYVPGLLLQYLGEALCDVVWVSKLHALQGLLLMIVISSCA